MSNETVKLNGEEISLEKLEQVKESFQEQKDVKVVKVGNSEYRTRVEG